MFIIQDSLLNIKRRYIGICEINDIDVIKYKSNNINDTNFINKIFNKLYYKIFKNKKMMKVKISLDNEIIEMNINSYDYYENLCRNNSDMAIRIIETDKDIISILGDHFLTHIIQNDKAIHIIENLLNLDTYKEHIKNCSPRNDETYRDIFYLYYGNLYRTNEFYQYKIYKFPYFEIIYNKNSFYIIDYLVNKCDYHFNQGIYSNEKIYNMIFKINNEKGKRKGVNINDKNINKIDYSLSSKMIDKLIYNNSKNRYVIQDYNKDFEINEMYGYCWINKHKLIFNKEEYSIHVKLNISHEMCYSGLYRNRLICNEIVTKFLNKKMSINLSELAFNPHPIAIEIVNKYMRNMSINKRLFQILCENKNKLCIKIIMDYYKNYINNDNEIICKYLLKNPYIKILNIN